MIDNICSHHSLQSSHPVIHLLPPKWSDLEDGSYFPVLVIKQWWYIIHSWVGGLFSTLDVIFERG